MYLGIDIGGTKIAGGLVTRDGTVTRRAAQPTPVALGGIYILKAAIEIARSLASHECLDGIGVGTGGTVDGQHGVVTYASELLPGWAGSNIKAAFESEFGATTAVDNDVNALAVGEMRFGAACGRDTVIFLALGTGVGGALLLGGHLHHGAHWGGGELGGILLTCDPNARQAANGRGTLEAYVSGQGLVQTWREITGDAHSPLTGHDIAKAAAADPCGSAAKAITLTGDFLGYGLVSLANALDPDLIVIGGGMASLGELLLSPARQILSANARPGPADCPIVLASGGPDAAVVGAASLAMPL